MIHFQSDVHRSVATHTSVIKAKVEALPHLKDVLYWNLDEFRSWSEQALLILRELRRVFPGTGDVMWRERAASEYTKHGLSPSRLLERLHDSKASERLRREK